MAHGHLHAGTPKLTACWFAHHRLPMPGMLYTCTVYVSFSPEKYLCGPPGAAYRSHERDHDRDRSRRSQSRFSDESSDEEYGGYVPRRRQGDLKKSDKLLPPGAGPSGIADPYHYLRQNLPTDPVEGESRGHPVEFDNDSYYHATV